MPPRAAVKITLGVVRDFGQPPEEYVVWGTPVYDLPGSTVFTHRFLTPEESKITGLDIEAERVFLVREIPVTVWRGPGDPDNAPYAVAFLAQLPDGGEWRVASIAPESQNRQRLTLRRSRGEP